MFQQEYERKYDGVGIIGFDPLYVSKDNQRQNRNIPVGYERFNDIMTYDKGLPVLHQIVKHHHRLSQYPNILNVWYTDSGRRNGLDFTKQYTMWGEGIEADEISQMYSGCSPYDVFVYGAYVSRYDMALMEWIVAKDATIEIDIEKQLQSFAAGFYEGYMQYDELISNSAGDRAKEIVLYATKRHITFSTFNATANSPFPWVMKNKPGDWYKSGIAYGHTYRAWAEIIQDPGHFNSYFPVSSFEWQYSFILKMVALSYCPGPKALNIIYADLLAKKKKTFFDYQTLINGYAGPIAAAAAIRTTVTGSEARDYDIKAGNAELMKTFMKLNTNKNIFNKPFKIWDSLTLKEGYTIKSIESPEYAAAVEIAAIWLQNRWIVDAAIWIENQQRYGKVKCKKHEKEQSQPTENRLVSDNPFGQVRNGHEPIKLQKEWGTHRHHALYFYYRHQAGQIHSIEYVAEGLDMPNEDIIKHYYERDNITLDCRKFLQIYGEVYTGIESRNKNKHFKKAIQAILPNLNGGAKELAEKELQDT